MALIKNVILMSTLALVSSCASRRQVVPDNSEFTKVLSTPEYQEKIYSCYESLILKKPKAEGRLTLNYYFYNKFKKDVKAINISESLQDTEFINCVEAKAKDVDVSHIFEQVDLDYDYTMEVKNTYSFKYKAVPISPKPRRK